MLHVFVGLLFFAHGVQKLFGWLGGYGIDGTAGFMESLGLRPGRLHAVVAGRASSPSPADQAPPTPAEGLACGR